MISPGTKLGKYTVDTLIGRGGAGSVYRAIQEGPGGFNRPVAIKVLHGPLNATKFERLAREARIIGRLQQRNVVQVLELASTPDLYFLVMELIDGLTLRQLQDMRGETLPLSLVIHVGVEVCRALQYAHDLADDDGKPLGLIHRDIKPSNILINTQGDVKLSDFGIAKRLLVAADQYTSHGIIKGTPAYMSPEQREGLPATAASDVFALCKILYELAIGRWLGEVDGPPSFGNLSGTMIGSGFDAVISQGLQEEPSQRLTTKQLASELRALLPEVTPSEQLSDLGEELACCVKATLKSRQAETLPPAPIQEQKTEPMLPTTNDAKTVPDIISPQPKKTHPGVGPLAEPSPPRVPSNELPATVEKIKKQALRLAETEVSADLHDRSTERSSIDDNAKTIPHSPLSFRPTAETTLETKSPHRTLIALGAFVGAVLVLLTIVYWPDKAPSAEPGQPSQPRDKKLAKTADPPRPTPVDASRSKTVSNRPPHSTVDLKTVKPDTGVAKSPTRADVRPRKPAKVAPPRRPSLADTKNGSLSVNTIPWSTVYVDGKKMGTTPLYRVSIPSGKRLLLLTCKDGRSIKRHVTIGGEKHSNLGLLEFDKQTQPSP